MNGAVDKASDRGSPEAQHFKTEELAVHRGIYTAKAAGWGRVQEECTYATYLQITS